MRKLVVAILMLAGLVTATDWGVAAAAEYQIAKQLRSEFDLPWDPSVRINGFPFLTQALSGTYRSIDMQATGLPVVPLTEVAVEATIYDVEAPLDKLMSGSLATVQIEEVDGRVQIKDTDIGRAIGIEDLRISRPSEDEIRKVIGTEELDGAKERAGSDTGSGFDSDSSSDDGSDDSNGSDDNSGSGDSDGADESDDDTRAPVRLVATTDLVGEMTEVILIGMLELEGDVVRVEPDDVRLATDDVGEFSLPSSFRNPVLDVFSRTIDPGELPFTVEPESVDVQTGVIVVEGTTEDVSFSQAGLGAQ
ncbi:MAG: DUF2993 domain-containing protein [Pseudonocardiaceae bacterium]|nr:DUF2993 domain-containing protein [Pseudonocardiaceae bacterium]